MALCNMGSYIATVQANIELLPLILEDADNKLESKLSKNASLKHVTCYGEDGDIISINSFDFELIGGILATPIMERDRILITSIIPRQSGELKIFYVR